MSAIIAAASLPDTVVPLLNLPTRYSWVTSIKANRDRRSGLPRFLGLWPLRAPCACPQTVLTVVSMLTRIRAYLKSQSFHTRSRRMQDTFQQGFSLIDLKAVHLTPEGSGSRASLKKPQSMASSLA